MTKTKTPDTFLAVERALIILKRMAQSNEDVGVRDISRELGYSPPVTQKILNTLKLHGFVRQDEKSGRYALGLATLEVGQAMLAGLDVVKLSHARLEQLTAESRETSFLAIRDGLHTVYLDKVTSPNALRMDAEVGAIRPLNCTAVGKVFLAWGPRQLLQQAHQGNAFLKATPNSIVELEALQQDLEIIRQQGYATDRREYHPEGVCIAAPIFAQNGNLVAAITISGLASRMEGHIAEFARLVMEKAARVSADLGY